ncbi:MAG: LysM domain-containing protein [Verrucomicrobiota bacterium]|nr:LysM domain-containing protein [Verrucomicrobiota bacterium]
MRVHFFFVLVAVVGLSFVRGQEDNPAVAMAARQAQEERIKSLAGMVEDMRDAYEVQQRRIATLSSELSTLREQLREEYQFTREKLVTREDLKKLAEKVQEIDTNREADKKLILKEIQRLIEVAASTPVPEVKTAPVTPLVEESKPNPDGYYAHIVQKNETLSAIIEAYNNELKGKGKARITLDMVKKANPEINPNRLIVGKEVLIPVPPDKK